MPKGDKYINLTNYLKNINEENVKMSFKDIENLLGEKLCDSAYKYSKFWSNTESHSIYFGWFNAGYKKKFVDIDKKIVIFEKDTYDKNIDSNFSISNTVDSEINCVSENNDIKNILPFEIIEQNIKKYFKKMLEDEHARYMSWDRCFKAFKENGSKTNYEVIDFLALNLAFYLASWGMYRGSSFLFQKDYTIHIPTVRILQEKRYEILRGIAAENLLIESNLKLLTELSERISAVYTVEKPSFDDKINKVTDTLITKILFGTYCCVPAYDRFYKSAVKKYNISSTTYNKESIKAIAEFYCQNFKEFEDLRKNITNINRLGIEYPPMKLIDMCMWQIGYDLNEEEEK